MSAAVSPDESTRVTLEAWLVTDVGVVRDHNEDSAFSAPELGFFIVADGTGRPYKAYVRSPSFVHLSTSSQLIHDHFIADVVPIFGMINMIGGECDK